MNERIHKLLDKAWVAYAKGNPFMSDAEFDYLSTKYLYSGFTEGEPHKKVTHIHRLYSLQKVYDEEAAPSTVVGKVISSPKLDGAAISLLYKDGHLVQGATRGDGKIGEDITPKVYQIAPKKIRLQGLVQIDGEVVCPKKIENARNYVSGALGIKDMNDFMLKADNLFFVAYSLKPARYMTYTEDLHILEAEGFTTVVTRGLENLYRTDGEVYRLDNNKKYYELGYTEKHPRGAYARKQTSDVEIVETKLLDCKWQVGRTGKVTPVAIFEPIVIDDANINQATLHNAGFIENMGLDIGDTILVTRAGGIIPKVLGKV